MAKKILFLAGSTRKESVNKKLAKAAYKIALEKNIEATFIDLKDFPMPIYNGDLEDAEGLPEKAIELKKIFIAHDGVFIASPEYNSSFSPLLKNALDWISRKHEDNEPALVAYTGKIMALTAASPGGYGGLRGLVPLRMMLGNIGVLVLPEQLAIPNAYNAFDENGHLQDQKYTDTLANIIDRLAKVSA